MIMKSLKWFKTTPLVGVYCANETEIKIVTKLLPVDRSCSFERAIITNDGNIFDGNKSVTLESYMIVPFRKIIEFERYIRYKDLQPQPFNGTYYFLTSSNEINEKEWRTGDDADLNRYECGNFFTTFDAAHKQAQINVINKKLREYSLGSGEHINPWNGISIHYYIKYYNGSILIASTKNNRALNTIYFASREAAQDAIDDVGKEYLNIFCFS